MSGSRPASKPAKNSRNRGMTYVMRIGDEPDREADEDRRVDERARHLAAAAPPRIFW